MQCAGKSSSARSHSAARKRNPIGAEAQAPTRVATCGRHRLQERPRVPPHSRRPASAAAPHCTGPAAIAEGDHVLALRPGLAQSTGPPQFQSLGTVWPSLNGQPLELAVFGLAVKLGPNNHTSKSAPPSRTALADDLRHAIRGTDGARRSDYGDANRAPRARNLDGCREPEPGRCSCHRFGRQ
jgi:hypothetical protein